MNVRNVASLIRDDITTIGVKFHDHESKVYTYKATKDLAGTLAEGDLVLVQARGKIKPVVVVRVDTTSKIDPDFAVDYKWAFQKVDAESLDSLEKSDKALEEVLEEKRRSSVRDSALASLGISDTRDVTEAVKRITR